MACRCQRYHAPPARPPRADLLATAAERTRRSRMGAEDRQSMSTVVLSWAVGSPRRDWTGSRRQSAWAEYLRRSCPLQTKDGASRAVVSV